MDIYIGLYSLNALNEKYFAVLKLLMMLCKLLELQPLQEL
jgi:hypothetical protein